MKEPLKASVTSSCTRRFGGNPCGAKVVQRIASGDYKTIYAQENSKFDGKKHNLQAKDGLLEQLLVILATKNMAKNDRFQATREITMKKLANRPGIRAAEMPPIEPLTLRLQYERAKHLPPIMCCLSCVVLFPLRLVSWRCDGGWTRHLIFYTDIDLRQLGNCLRWYVDGNIKLVTKLFMRMWTINGFLKLKQISSNK